MKTPEKSNPKLHKSCSPTLSASTLNATVCESPQSDTSINWSSFPDMNNAIKIFQDAHRQRGTLPLKPVREDTQRDTLDEINRILDGKPTIYNHQPRSKDIREDIAPKDNTLQKINEIYNKSEKEKATSIKKPRFPCIKSLSLPKSTWLSKLLSSRHSTDTPGHSR